MTRTRSFVLLAALLLLAALAPLLQHRMFQSLLYPIPAWPVPDPPPEPLVAVELALPGGESALAWSFEAPPAAPGKAGIALVVLHGNGENLGTFAAAGMPRELAALGVSFLALDYPGYGLSRGKPSEAGNAAAARAALAWLAQHQPASKRVLWGWSLGAGVAVQAAAADPGALDGLVLLSPWTRLEDVAALHFPRWLVRLGLEETYDSLAVAAQLAMPALVVHGEHDEIIPAGQGHSLAAALPNARFVLVPNAGHNDLFARPEPWRESLAFLAALAQSAPQ